MVQRGLHLVGRLYSFLLLTISCPLPAAEVGTLLGNLALSDTGSLVFSVLCANRCKDELTRDHETSTFLSYMLHCR
jgi:hypothetical protein